MFTLKFIKNITDSGQNIQHIVAASSYEKHTMPDGSAIFSVPNIAAKNFTEFRVNKDHQETNSFERCYVENISGKTIDKASSDNLEL